MDYRLTTKITVPPDKLRVNEKAFIGRQQNDHINRNGCTIDYKQQAYQAGDVRLWVSALGQTAAEFSLLIGRPKKTVLRWLKDKPETFIEISNEAIGVCWDAIAAKQSGIPEIPYFYRGKTLYFYSL